MGSQSLSIGILGLDRRGQSLVEAIANVDLFEVRAVADRDLQRAEQVASRFDCPAFDDYRQFIVQTDLDCLLVVASLHSCLEYVRLALKSGVHVLKLPPMARTFEEASELANLAFNRKVCFDVATTYRYSDSFTAFTKRLMEDPPQKPFLIQVNCDVGMLPEEADEGLPIHPDHEMAWITDQALAGGGVLLQNGYELIDQLVATFGLPQQVYALCSSLASDKQQLHHLTEDRMLAVCRFGERVLADVVAMRHWDARESQATVRLLGRDQTLFVDTEQLGVYDSQGNSLEHLQFSYEPIEVCQDLLTAYAESLLKPQSIRFRSDSRSQLEVMAVMEAAYLSSRTGSPESPSRILDLGVR